MAIGDSTPNTQQWSAMSGTGNRLVQVDTSGNATATQTIIVGKISDSTVITKLTTESNWSAISAYSGSTISGTSEGQYYSDARYFFTAYSDNEIIRIDKRINKNRIDGYAITTTTNGTTTLSGYSMYSQYFTGTTGQTIVMPVVSTLYLGFEFNIVNKTNSTLTVNSSGGNLIYSLVTGRECRFRCIEITGTTANCWNVEEKLPKLTTDYVWVGVNNVPVETNIDNIIAAKGTLTSGQLTVTDTGITVNSFAVVTMSTVGVSTSVPIKYTASNGSMLFSTGQITDTCDFGYIIFI